MRAHRPPKIRRFFLDNFKYSLIQPGVYRRQPLQNFLQRTRRGHCEYFATAAVLLARHVGIPARYTVGYSVESYSPLERAYIARARHAHSWALVYVDGAWVVLDATPAVWFELEEDYASQWQTLQDLMTWLWYRYQRLNQADFSELQSWLIYLVPPLAIILYVRLRRSPAARKQSQRDDGASYHDPVDRDAALHRTVMHFVDQGLLPAQGESLSTFLRRCAPSESGGERLKDLLTLYYRQRFSPFGLSDHDQRELVRKAARYHAALAR